jgi:hypothetical protein
MADMREESLGMADAEEEGVEEGVVGGISPILKDWERVPNSTSRKLAHVCTYNQVLKFNKYDIYQGRALDRYLKWKGIGFIEGRSKPA